MSYRAFVEEIVKAVVEHPDQIEIEEVEEHGARTFFIRCSAEDVGKVIGKTGRVVSAIRCVVSAVASKYREKAFVKIVTD